MRLRRNRWFGLHRKSVGPSPALVVFFKRKRSIKNFYFDQPRILIQVLRNPIIIKIRCFFHSTFSRCASWVTSDQSIIVHSNSLQEVYVRYSITIIFSHLKSEKRCRNVSLPLIYLNFKNHFNPQYVTKYDN